MAALASAALLSSRHRSVEDVALAGAGHAYFDFASGPSASPSSSPWTAGLHPSTVCT